MTERGQWEYLYLSIEGKEGMEKLAQAGSEGWELVSVTYGFLVSFGAWLKRPTLEQDAPKND